MPVTMTIRPVVEVRHVIQPMRSMVGTEVIVRMGLAAGR